MYEINKPCVILILLFRLYYIPILTHYQLLIYYYYYYYYYYIANVLQSDFGRCCNNYYLRAYIAENLLLLFGCLERRAGRQTRIFNE